MLATATLVAVAPTLTQSVTVCTTQREQTVRDVFPSSMTNRGDTGLPTTPSLASRVAATTTLPVAAITQPLIHFPIATRSEEGAYVTTVKTTLVRNLPIILGCCPHLIRFSRKERIIL